MAEECTESSVATSSSAPPNWWDLQPSSGSLSSWSNANPWHQPNPNSNSSCDEDVSISTSFTNASNHSGLTVESSRRLVEPAASSSDELIGEQASDNHIWNHVLLGVGSNGDLHNHQDVGENFLDGLASTKSMSTTGMFEPACDYLKKLDHSTWEFTNPSSFNNFDHKQMNGFNETMIENERLTKLSNLVSTWSIAPPEPEVNRQFMNPQTCNNNISLSSSMDHLKQTFSDSTACEIGGNRNNNSSLFSCYGHALKAETGHDQTEIEAPGALLRRSFNGNIGYQIGLNSPIIGDNNKYYYGMPAADSYSSCTSARNLADVISFTSRLGKPLIDIHAPNKPSSFKSSLNLSDNSKKDGLQTSSAPTRVNARGQGNTNEGKKKRSEDNSETSLKRPKQESSTVSSVKLQAPKVKLGDRITALQQIVSPFGKTDTASVLLEAIQYIKFLQEQVQLLSNPYMKSNSHKDPWASLDRKEKGDIKLDLRSRGCTPYS
ncbi:hypothetical protein FNV43_RR25742 [Rhamnella rubrinervis]|uniref:BHLH domain-containing protein n=1 Tax=Rhamnella rubrinervis TaxID=2594499 RepID=A0A8K0DHC9_9ROSA|nr:hypothetical protein FNV43_RR25742 [Rhamnella rubrinervis]